MLSTLHQLKGGTPTGPEKLHILHVAYAYTMDRVDHPLPELRSLAKQALLCVKSAKRPLTLFELQDALAHKSGSPDIISRCAGLIRRDEKSEKVHVAHYTVLEYLEQVRLLGVVSMTEVCVNYLTSSMFGGGFCDTDDSFEARLSANPFYDYAARNWGHHARESLTVHQETLLFLNLQDNVEAASQVLHAVKRFPEDLGYSQAVPRDVKGLHLAAYFGATDLVNSLLEGGLDPDPRDSYGRTPLWYACQSGHKAVVVLLLENRADVAARDRNDCTPLLNAAKMGHKTIANLLLGDGADIEAKDVHGSTPLMFAATGGREATVQQLIADGANTEAKDEGDQTALSRAVCSQNLGIVQLLLENGAHIETRDTKGQTPLSLAAGKGYIEIVQLLLDSGADANARDLDNQTPLKLAAMKSHGAVVELLSNFTSIA